MTTTPDASLQVNPGLVGDIVLAAERGARAGHPNTGMVAVLNAVALLQITHASNRAHWDVSRGEVEHLTGFSTTTVRRGLKHFVQHRVLIERDILPTGTTYIFNLG